MLTRENTKLVVLGVVCLLLAWTGPSVAHGVHARFAHNADKVDGKHAVGAGATRNRARGKLVAHDRTGRMPLRFLPRAVVTEDEYRKRPDAALLAGGHVASNGTIPAGFFTTGTWDAVRTGTGRYLLRFRAPAMCDATLWPGLQLTAWHTHAEVSTAGSSRNCDADTDAFTFIILVRDSGGEPIDNDWGFTAYGFGGTVGPVSAARAVPGAAVRSR